MTETLLSVAEAQEKIVASLQPTDSEPAALEHCAGRVLAQAVTAQADLPAFDNSSMDGFALRAADLSDAQPNTPVSLPVVADIAAGSSRPLHLSPGQAARIMTGAPLPGGADAVLPVEDTDHAPGRQFAASMEQVLCFQPVVVGENVRRRGMDVQQGQQLLPAGRRLRAQDVGMLAAAGLAEVMVYRRPRVGIFSSGDELVSPGQPLGPGQIYDANRFALAAWIEQAGGEVTHTATAPDDPAQIRRALDTMVENGVDVIVSSAGVSVGAYDYIRGIIEAQGRLDFWKVNMRPGKPLAYGSYRNVPFLGLPGNPVSAFIGCLVFVQPALRCLSGQPPLERGHTLALLEEPVESDGRESYLRAVVRREEGQLVARLTGHQGSGNLFSLVQANALLIVPSGVKSLPAKSLVEIWFLTPE